MRQGRKSPGSKKYVCYKILYKTRQAQLQVTVLAPGEITFDFSPCVCLWSLGSTNKTACMLQNIHTILMVSPKMLLLGLRQSAVMLRYPCIGMARRGEACGRFWGFLCG